MNRENFATISRNFIMDPIASFSDQMREEPLSTICPRLPVTENYWPPKPWTPNCDIYETKAEIVLKFELPEVKHEDVEVTIQNQVLMLRGERKFAGVTKRENYHRIERHYGAFMRSFIVPMSVDATRISADFKEGVLTVTLPKREEAIARPIDVKNRIEGTAQNNPA